MTASYRLMLPGVRRPGGGEARPLADRRRLRVLGLQLAFDRLAVRRQRVGFPVIEVQLGGGADLALGALGVLDVGQADRDLIAAGGLDLGLGDAQLVDALAHDVDRAVERGLRDVRRLPARLALIDELRPALEVEPELGRLGEDHEQRCRDQPQDQEQDEAVTLAVGHRSRRMLEDYGAIGSRFAQHAKGPVSGGWWASARAADRPPRRRRQGTDRRPRARVGRARRGPRPACPAP